MAKTILPVGSYTYIPFSQQVDFSNFTSATGAVFDFTRLFAIIDVTQGQIIYSTAGSSSGLSGSYSAPTLTLAFNTTGFPGGDLQIIYDLASTPSATYDGTGTQPILSSTDPITGREGLDINLLNSSFGGQLTYPLPSYTTSGYNAALSMGFINGGNLVAPNMDAMTNNLKVDIDSFSPTAVIPVSLVSTSINQPIDLVNISGASISTANPLPTGLASSSGNVIDYNAGSSTNNTIRTASNLYANGQTLITNSGGTGSDTLRVVANLNTNAGVPVSVGNGTVDTGTIRTALGELNITGAVAQSASGNNIITGSTGAVDYTGYRFFCAQINQSAGISAGTYTFEGSEDNATFFTIPVTTIGSTSTSTGSGPFSAAPSQQTVYFGQLNFRFFRIRIGTTITGGTIQGFVKLSQTPIPFSNTTGQGTSDVGTQRVTLALDQPTISTNISQYGGTNTTLGQKTLGLSLPVALSTDTALGNISSLSGFVALGVTGYTAVAIDVRGTFSQTLTFQGSIDGSNFISLNAVPYGAVQNTALTPNATASGAWVVQCAGCDTIRVVSTAYTSGSATVRIRATNATGWVYNAPVGTTNAVAVSGSLTTVTTVSTVSNITAGTITTVQSDNLASSTTTDIASGAITTTTTSANIATTNIQSVAFQIAVTAVTGTTPTLDVVIQETMDGTNYYDIYHYERITAAGSFFSPVMKLAGIGFRYVRTVTGTSPSFTMSAIRISRAGNASLVRRLFNRTIDPNTTGSASSSLLAEGTNQPYLVVSLGAGGSGGSPVFGIQGSEDGSNWYAINGSTVTVTTNSIGHANPLQGHLPKFIRAAVTSVGGSGYTLNYASIKSMGP
jgi:hypothetical protein